MTSAPTELLIAPRVSVELMIESCLKGFGTAFEGVGTRRHEAQSVLASVCFADADSQI